MTTLRFKMVEEAIGRKAVEVKAPAERPAEYFGKYVFDRDKMRKYLPKACFETLMDTMKKPAVHMPILMPNTCSRP